ncbi:MAG TPA: bacteriocin [Bacteroidales bacterium]|nr:bacteriocin [Bacteroidales bacterium]
MKNSNQKNDAILNSKELTFDELTQVNGGADDGDLAKVAGFSWVFTTAHILTGGLSTYAYLIRKYAM